MMVNFSFNVLNDIDSKNYTSNMKQNLRQKKFLEYFKKLTEKSSLSYQNAQFLELKKYGRWPS